MIGFTQRYTIDTLPVAREGRAVALGFFDGIHIGHLDVIRSMSRFAAKNGLKSCVQTFINMPRNSGGELTTIEERLKILTELKIDELLVLDYNDIRDTDPGIFCAEYINMRMGAHAVFAGDDYRFGAGAAGDTDLLERSLEAMNIDTFICEIEEDGGRKISSTWLKELLSEGRPDRYAELTSGRYFTYTGRVIKGKQMGSKMGFPTANLAIPEGKFRVRRGVYISRVTIGKETYAGVTNIGLRPTLEDATQDICETHILDFDEDIYGAVITVELVKFLRDETHFSSPEELIEAVNSNKQDARQYFGM